MLPPLKIFLLTSLAVASQTSAAGISSSGTGSVLTTESNPWFIGDQPVTYCIQSSSQVSLDADQIQQTVRAALDDWTTTLKSVALKSTMFKLPDGLSKSISTTFEEQRCRSSTQLIFKIGVFDANVETDLAHLPVRTIAFAQMIRFEDSTGSAAQGYVWITPDRGPRKYQDNTIGTNFWQQDNALRAVVLHELGHVFGFAHVGTGLMSETFPAEVIGGDGNRHYDWRFGGTTTPVTSKEMLLSSWVTLNPWNHPSTQPKSKYCGVIATPSPSGILDVAHVLNLTPNRRIPEGVVPVIPSYYACLTRTGINSGDGSISVQMEIFSADGALHAKYWIQPRANDVHFSELTGRYNKFILDGAPQPIGNRPVSQKYLLLVDSYRIRGKTTIGESKAAVLIEGAGAKARVTFFIDGECTLFDIEWQPNLNL